MKAARFTLLLLCLLALPNLGHAASTVWLEAEQFRNLGGWVNDAQFVDQMGSPYLLAIGLEGPVGDAVTPATIPAAGKYRLWVRSRDWVPEFSPGKFQVLLGGKKVEKVFGASKKEGWVWEDGGTVQLRAGPLEVRLHDLTGHYSRCDALLLTDDLDYCPPTGLAELAAVREQWGGVSRTPEVLKSYDTVVVGGGLAGCFAAVASARGGARTALVQDRPVLGGNTSSEILVNPEGDTTREPLDPGEGGIIEEIRGKAQDYSPRMLKLVKKEPNLDLYLNTHATGVEKKPSGEIAALKALEVTSGKRLVIPGTIFIDATGDGVVGVWAGAEYRHGREPRDMFNESRAPEKADERSGTMGGTLRYATELADKSVPFHTPAWARHFPQCNNFGEGRHPQLHFGGWQWVIEYGGIRDTYRDAEEIRDELVRIIWGMWDHAKNDCPKLAKEADKYKLVWVSHVVGKRESRRLIGDYVMTEHDITPTRLFPDRVSYGGWGIDLHPPLGFYDPGPPATFSHKFKFSVPLRSLYSKNVNNLMMAGRCISVTHAALGATRVMITCGLQGQAAGTAASLCKFHHTTPRGIYESYIDELQQQLLKDGCYLIDLPSHDSKDLARTASVTASSVSPPVEIESRSRLAVHPLNNDRAVMFKVSGGRLNKVSLYLGSKNDRPTTVKLGLRAASALGDFSAAADLAQATARVPAKSRGWIDFPLQTQLKPGFYYVWLSRTPGVEWWLFDVAPPDTARAYRGGSEWTRMSDCYRFRLDPPGATNTATAKAEPAEPKPAPEKPKAKMFVAENVVNGIARAERGWPNSWRPEPGKPLPQWIELDFGRPVEFNCVHVSFQSKQLRAEQFRLEVAQGDSWRAVAELSDNLQRRRVVYFPRTRASRLRLVVLKANAEMGVCEIRVYDEPDPNGPTAARDPVFIPTE